MFVYLHMYKKHLMLDTLKCYITLGRTVGDFGFLLCTSLCLFIIFCHENAFPLLAEKLSVLQNDLK